MGEKKEENNTNRYIKIGAGIILGILAIFLGYLLYRRFAAPVIDLPKPENARFEGNAWGRDYVSDRIIKEGTNKTVNNTAIIDLISKPEMSRNNTYNGSVNNSELRKMARKAINRPIDFNSNISKYKNNPKNSIWYDPEFSRANKSGQPSPINAQQNNNPGFETNIRPRLSRIGSRYIPTPQSKQKSRSFFGRLKNRFIK